MRRKSWIVAVLFAVGAAIAIAWLSSSEPETSERTRESDTAEEQPSGDFGLFFEDPTDLAAADAGGAEGGSGFDRRFRDMTPEERRALRARRRERFRNMTPEERRRLLARRIRIEPLGEATPTLAPEDVAEAMREARRAARDCVRDNGGFRALRRAMRGRSARGDAGRRGFTIGFEVDASGAVDPSSVVLDPPPPPPFYDCFAESIIQTQLAPPGPDGAKIEMDLGRRRRRRPSE